MSKPYQVLPPTAPVPAPDDVLERLVLEGARKMLQDALEAEVDDFLGRRRYQRSNETRGYRNGHLPERTIGVGMEQGYRESTASWSEVLRSLKERGLTFFESRVWHVPRNRPDPRQLERAAEWIRAYQRPLIVAGGGVIYSEATDALCRFVERTAIPASETMAGKGSLRFDNPLNLGAIGATGTSAANQAARDADLIIGIGTRYSDFTTASKTAFQDPAVRFVNVNVAEFDAAKHNALAPVGDARATLEELSAALRDFKVAAAYRQRAEQLHAHWEAEVERIYATRLEPLPSQGMTSR